jgi:hemerythrin-like metal-binding protein
MALVKWGAEYSVGSEEDDGRNQRLFALTNRLHEAMRCGQGRAILGEVFQGLSTYSEHYLATQDWVLDEGGDGQGAHQAAHAQLVRRLAELKARYEAGGIHVSVEAAILLQDWIKLHIPRRTAPSAPSAPLRDPLHIGILGGLLGRRRRGAGLLRPIQVGCPFPGVLW